MEATIKAEVKKLGDDHPDTLTARHNLALAFAEAGRITEAIDLFEATLKAKVKKLETIIRVHFDSKEPG